MSAIQEVDTPAIALPPLGQLLTGQGGYFVGVLRGEDGRSYGQIAAPDDFDDTEWGGYGKSVKGTASAWDGASNTRALIEHGDHPAAKLAAEYENEGFKDFILPARRQLAVAEACAPELFKKEPYWTSTQCSANLAWAVRFQHGGVDTWNKSHAFRVRPFRSFLIA